MLYTRAMSAARAFRAFATARDMPFLSDAVAKAAIGADLEVAASFVSAFAPVVHHRHVRVTDVSSLQGTTTLTPVRDMKHDIALRYKIGGAESAVMEVVTTPFNRALVEIQRQPETYLPGRALAHASGHYLAAIAEEAKVVKENKRKEAEKEASRLAASADSAAGKSRRKSPSKSARALYDNAVYSAYVSVEPVHLLMLSDFCSAHDTADNKWRAPKTLTATGKKYGWATPLFSTFRLTSGAQSLQLVAGLDNPGLSAFASSLRERLSITIVHLPMVPSVLNDAVAWRNVVTLPEHQKALESDELRRWLHYLARASLKDGKVEMPVELRALPIFRKSAEQAEALLGNKAVDFSEKDVADIALQSKREGKEEGQAEGRVALEEQRVAAAAVLKVERAAAAAALEEQQVAAEAALEEQRVAAAAALEAAVAKLRAEFEPRKKPDPGAQ